MERLEFGGILGTSTAWMVCFEEMDKEREVRRNGLKNDFVDRFGETQFGSENYLMIDQALQDRDRMINGLVVNMALDGFGGLEINPFYDIEIRGLVETGEQKDKERQIRKWVADDERTLRNERVKVLRKMMTEADEKNRINTFKSQDVDLFANGGEKVKLWGIGDVFRVRKEK